MLYQLSYTGIIMTGERGRYVVGTTTTSNDYNNSQVH